MEYLGNIEADYFPYEMVGASYTGEQKLCAAVLVSAIKDLYSKKFVLRAAAKRWFNSKSVEPFSFIWCLQHIFPTFYDEIDILKLVKSLENLELWQQYYLGIEALGFDNPQDW